MPIPDIDFRQIRPRGGSRQGGFEELCCQLASLEYANREGEFYRKGLGGDAGVECFFRDRAGRETGWQAKYFFNFTAVQRAQLDDSLNTALKKHPRLQTYIVCLPFDFKDSRQSGTTSELKRWEEWKKKHLQSARKAGRKLAIVLWGSTFLRSRLSQDDPSYAGRTFYWFESTVLTHDWFLLRFNEAKANLGERYTPEVSVEVQIRRALFALGRDEWLSKQLDEWKFKVQERTYSVVWQLRSLRKFGVKDVVTAKLIVALEAFLNLLNIPYEDPRTNIPVVELITAVKVLNAVSGDALALARTAKEPPPPKKKPKPGQPTRTAQDAVDYLRHEVYRFHDLLEEVESALTSDPWNIVNKHELLVYGKAGSGKSHSLADVADSQIKLGRPAILILGQTLVEGEPWQQIRSNLDLHSLPTEVFLGALDAAGQASGVRTLVLVDAINERHGLNIWPTRLAAFLTAIKRFDNIAIVLSCRTTYLDRIIPPSVGATIPQLEHLGFGGKASEAARYYLAKRGIVRPGMPNFMPEFNNPLFLKTICDALERSGAKEIPKGLQGVTAAFRFYIRSVADSLEKRMALDPHRDIVALAIDRMVEAMIAAKRGWLKKAEALALLDALHPSGNKADESLLFQFENEGLITIEAVSEEEVDGEFVRFTFERMSDHFIARALLSLHLDRANPNKSFSADGPLGRIVTGRNIYGNAGLLEAMAIQLPELTDSELLDVVPLDKHDAWQILEAFKDSLLWRDQGRFSDHTMQLCDKVYENDALGKMRLLISIATEPPNKFNGHWLHAWLNEKSLPERDGSWSILVAEDAKRDDSPIWTLIQWAFDQGGEAMDQARRTLAAITLAWLLTTTHRSVRDRATKALARVLSVDFRIAANTLRAFANVNDPYISERVYAAVYGAVLQGQMKDGLSELSEFIFDTIFKDGSPAPYALLRDSARGVLEYASKQGSLPDSVNLRLARPPYKVVKKLEFISEGAIKQFTQTYESGNVFPDQIVSSSVNDGDFARYVIDGIAGSWSATPIGRKKNSAEEHYRRWLKRFAAFASGDQLAAYDKVEQAAKSYESTNVAIALDELKGMKRSRREGTGPIRVHFSEWNKGREEKRQNARKALEAAERHFMGTLSQEQAEDFRVYASGYVGYSLFSGRSDERPMSFDQTWARRWVCKRAHELGWSGERFFKWERNSSGSYSRTNHGIERIGKKYQWIALDELVAHLSDQYSFIGRYGSDEGEHYDGPWQVGHRHIDPSLHILRTYDDGWRQWDKTWWVPIAPRMKPASVEARLGWLHSEKDVVNDASLISLLEPKSGRRWVVVDGFASWKTRGITNGRETLERETWYRLTCIVVAKTRAQELLKTLIKRRLTSPHDLASVHFPDSAYLGEYPWHPVCARLAKWTHDPGASVSVPVRPPVARYSASTGGYDYSVDETVHVTVPAPWLMTSLSLSLDSGQAPRYVDTGGVVRFFDPAVFEPGPHAALVDEGQLEKALKKEGLEAFWIIAGEKSVYGDLMADRGFGGRYVHTAVYQRGNDGKFKRYFHFEMELPYREQLAALFDNNEIPREFRKLIRTRRPVQTCRQTFSRQALKALVDQAIHDRRRTKRRRH